jgi:GT2 family glycosyltransferase
MKIDVVVPIYNAYDVLKDCLNSLIKYQTQVSNIILINDASTDQRMKSYLDRIAYENKWNIIHQNKNMGFVHTANCGLKLSKNHTVLLNSDTIVTKPWIAAFKSALKNNPTLGTATPWSNNAEICSFPQFLFNQPPIKDINKFAKQLFKHHRPRYPNLPTAVGFCMLVSKKAKKLVGYLDEGHFGHGYGEENDYSMRVANAGLKNLLCDNAYVAHIGNQSFSDFGLSPNEDTMKRLLEKHPNYLSLIQKFINLDPLSPIRSEILTIVKNYKIKL